jgi:uncharacterized membrane protein
MFAYLHPILASFPFPLFVAAFLTEVVAYFGVTTHWRLHSFFLVILGGIFSVAAYYSGYYHMSGASITFQISEEIVSGHQNVARMQLFSLTPLLLFAFIRALKPNEFFHWLFIPFLILTLLLTGSTSHKGGMLVFQEGAGVARECPCDDPEPDEAATESGGSEISDKQNRDKV